MYIRSNTTTTWQDKRIKAMNRIKKKNNIKKEKFKKKNKKDCI